MLGWAGFDFVVIDAEHAPHTYASAYRSIVAAQGFGMAALVRLPDQQGGDVQRMLDAGADGVLVPRVRSAAEARAAVAGMTFSPAGSRGMGITSRAGRWGMQPVPAYVKHGNERIVRAMQLEDPEALRDAPAILEVAGVNAAFVGLGDLSLVTGLPGNHPQNDALVDDLLAACRQRHVPCGTAVGDAAAAQRSRQRGFSFVMVSNDASLFGRAASDLMKAVKA
jgi:2-dehydro-3-deoxyglucarate aldolase/4-hydroxy-2-oxoheptanedioate aldolase